MMLLEFLILTRTTEDISEQLRSPGICQVSTFFEGGGHWWCWTLPNLLELDPFRRNAARVPGKVGHWRGWQGDGRSGVLEAWHETMMGGMITSTWCQIASR